MKIETNVKNNFKNVQNNVVYIYVASMQDYIKCWRIFS